jgi:hypothetical protein
MKHIRRQKKIVKDLVLLLVTGLKNRLTRLTHSNVIHKQRRQTRIQYIIYCTIYISIGPTVLLSLRFIIYNNVIIIVILNYNYL